MSLGLLWAFAALAAAPLAESRGWEDAPGYDPDDPEPEDWRERRAWLERMDARSYGEPVPGERYSHPRPMPAAELERWRAAEAKRARRASKRRGLS
jgi:hypothetical protein